MPFSVAEFAFLIAEFSEYYRGIRLSFSRNPRRSNWCINWSRLYFYISEWSDISHIKLHKDWWFHVSCLSIVNGINDWSSTQTFALLTIFQYFSKVHELFSEFHIFAFISYNLYSGDFDNHGWYTSIYVNWVQNFHISWRFARENIFFF